MDARLKEESLEGELGEKIRPLLAPVFRVLDDKDDLTLVYRPMRVKQFDNQKPSRDEAFRQWDLRFKKQCETTARELTRLCDEYGPDAAPIIFEFLQRAEQLHPLLQAFAFTLAEDREQAGAPLDFPADEEAESTSLRQILLRIRKVMDRVLVSMPHL